MCASEVTSPVMSIAAMSHALVLLLGESVIDFHFTSRLSKNENAE